MSNEFIEKISNYSIDKLDELIKEAEYNYTYNISKFTDEEYESLLEIYNYKTGEHRVSNVIESKDLETMVKLPVWMPSLDKIHHGNNSELIKFKKKNVGPYIISSKMDGGSALLDYNNGNMKLYTRGTYEKGQDITLLIKYLNLPKKFNEYFEGYVRGEIIMPESVFKTKYSKLYSNARALIGGIFRYFNRSNTKFANNTFNIEPIMLEIISDINFVAYEIISIKKDQLELKPSKQLKLLTKAGFTVVKFVKISDLNYNDLSDIFDLFVSEMDYNIDGLVIYNNINNKRMTSGKPDYAIAYKKELENLIGYSKVIDIEWNISKEGLIKPIVIIEPIIINSVKINKTTGKNAKFIINNRLGPGAEVKIIRSGDVIPNIMEVIEPAKELKYPMVEYEWNKTNTDFILKHDTELNKEMQLKKILHFFETLNIIGIGKKTILEIAEALDIYTIEDFIMLEKKDIEFVGPKTAEKIINGLKENIISAPLVILMHASGIFNGGLGKKKLELIVETVNIFDYSESNIGELYESINKLKGFATLTTEKFINNFLEFRKFYDKLNRNDINNKDELNKDELKKKKKDKINDLANKKICLTGFRDDKIMNFVKKSNGEITTNISKNTYLLVIKDLMYQNTKTDFAAKNNIQIMTKDEFYLKYNNLE